MRFIMPIIIFILMANAWGMKVKLAGLTLYWGIGILCASTLVIIVVSNRKNGKIKRTYEADTQQDVDQTLVNNAKKIKEITGETPVTDFDQKQNRTKKYIFQIFKKSDLDDM